MYNGNVIKRLIIDKTGCKASDVAFAVYKNRRRDISPLYSGNPTAETLEAIADFFSVPIDALFIRGGKVDGPAGDMNETAKEYANLYINSLKETIENQKQIIADKDKEIRSLKMKLRKQVAAAKKSE